MAERKAAENDFNPRHRIIGAVILVVLAVVVLPMLLSDHPPATRSTGGGESPPPETRVVTVPVPAPGDKSAAAGRTAAGQAAPATAPSAKTSSVPVEPVLPAPIDEAAPAPAATPSPPAPKSELAPAKATASAAKPTAGAASKSVATGKWVIQAGAFSQVENARHLQERLRQKGFTATLDPANPAHAKTVKVLVGPYRDEAAARAAAARLHGELGIQGIVRSR